MQDIKRGQAILALIIASSAIIGLLFSVDGRYAKAGDLNNVSVRLEQKILMDKSDNLQQRLWKLEDRFEGREMPQVAKEEVRRLRKEKRDLEMQIKELK